jgi:hypothetical protein
MAKLKPGWQKTDIPTHIKVALWGAMKGNPTFGSWGKAVAMLSFDEDDDKYVKISRATYKTLQQEIKLMPESEIRSLPGDIQDWISNIRGDSGAVRSKDRQKQNEELLTLLEQQAQLESLSIVSLLNLYVQTWNPTTEFIKPEGSQVLLSNWRQAWEKTDRREKAKSLGIDTIKNDLAYNRLRQAYPDAELLEAVEAYDEAKLAFVEAFSAWIAVVELTTEQGPQKEDVDGTGSSYAATIGRFTDRLKRSSPEYWLYLKLRCLLFACQLVQLGFEEQVAAGHDTTCVNESAALLSFWNNVIQFSIELLPQALWLAERNDLRDMAESLWHIDDPIRSKTMCLLEAQARMNIAWKNLQEMAWP